MNSSNRPVAQFALLVSVSALVGTLGSPHVARSYPVYPPFLPNRASAVSPQDAATKPCITCHNNPDGGQGCATPPCLNPFGLAFMGANHVWTPTLAMLDSDGDGYTNGQELQDPAGTWTVGQTSPGVGAHVSLPGFNASANVLWSPSTFSPGLIDADHDGFCWFGHDMNGDTDCIDAGENTATDNDCDDANTAVHSGATELCTNAIDDDCNGLDTIHDPACAAVVDADGDSFCPMGRDMNADHDCIDAGENTTDVDCNDTNLLIRPGAPENCLDGLDNDCDTLIDGADSNCTGEADFDHDGYCPIGVDANNDGDCLDGLTETGGPSDCNDQDATVNPGKTEVCGNLQDDDCDLSADFSDSDCATQADSDGDGYCAVGKDVNLDGDCADVGIDVLGAAAYDCDDTNATIYSLATEICTDTVDQDCDGQPALLDPDCVAYLDRDGDLFCPIGGVDGNNDGDCVDMGEFQLLYDCKDFGAGAAAINPLATELCTDGVDNDCNGVADATSTVWDPHCVAFVDRDFDGFCGPGTDSNADGDCVDASEQTVVNDLAQDDPTISPGNHESCFDMRDNDQDGSIDAADSECVNTHDTDGDGYCPMGKDVNHDGDCADAGENYKQSDCDDSSTAIGPQVPEIFVEGALLQRCFDHDDNDCDGNWDTGVRGDVNCGYLFDRDHDGFCGHGVDDNQDRDCLDTDEQRFGDDCDDNDPTRASALNELCSDHIDNNCDNRVDLADPTCQCARDVDCTQTSTCQVGVCTSGVCQYVADPACTDAGVHRSGGLLCGVNVGQSAPAWLSLFTLMAALFAVLARRGARSMRRVRASRRLPTTRPRNRD